MKKIFLMIPVILLFFVLPSQLFALEVPSLTGRVVDKAGILDSDEENEISNYLNAVEDASGAQIAVLTIESLEGENLEMFTYRTATEWKLGEEDKDNGALLLIVVSDRKLRIELGYGLEGVLTDASSGYIIRNIITPSFKTGDYAGGIFAGVQAMGGLISGDIPASQYQQNENSAQRSAGSPGASAFGIIIFFIIFVLKIGFMIRRPGLFFLGGMGRGYRSTTGSSFSGGGFSGGGGSFGGGGASGGW